MLEKWPDTSHSYILSTPAAPGDYENRSYQVEFQVDSQRGTLVVSAELDYILEKDEQLKAMLSVPAGIQRVSEGTPSEAIVTIRDQTAAEVYINSTTYSVLEGQPANVTLKLTRTIAPTVTIVVFLLTWDVSAIGVCTRIRCVSPSILHHAMP